MTLISITVLLLLFLSTSTKPQALNIVLSKVWLRWCLIGVKGVEEGNRISPLEGYWQLLFIAQSTVSWNGQALQSQ